MHRARGWLTVVAVAAALFLAAPAFARAEAVYLFPRLDQTSFGYQDREYKPRTINLPDDLQAVGIHWGGWGTARATGVGHVIDEPHNVLRFTASRITSDARAVAECHGEHAPPLTRYYGRLVIRALSPALELDDEVEGNFAAAPTIQC